MPVRYADLQPLATQATAMAARLAGGGSDLVHENQTQRADIRLPLEPILAPLQDIGTVLLAGVRRLF
jgi:hypothetical protein